MSYVDGVWRREPIRLLLSHERDLKGDSLVPDFQPHPLNFLVVSSVECPDRSRRGVWPYKPEMRLLSKHLLWKRLNCRE